jgi:hypothetical protein
MIGIATMLTLVTRGSNPKMWRLGSTGSAIFILSVAVLVTLALLAG